MSRRSMAREFRELARQASDTIRRSGPVPRLGSSSRGSEPPKRRQLLPGWPEPGGHAADLAGQAFATVFRAIKAVRPVRPIHPRGISLLGELTQTGADGRAAGGIPGARSGISWLDAAGTEPVQARFSRSVGLPEALPDILGLALRTGPADQPADMLFASTGWGFPARFMLIPKLDVRSARFTTLMPYQGADGPVLLGLRTLSLPSGATGRADTGGNFKDSLADGEWSLALSFATPAGRWVPAGVLRLRAAPASDDASARFDPLEHPLPGAGTYPWARRLRERSYRAARRPAPLKAAPLKTAALKTPPKPDERNPMSTVTRVFNSPAADVWKVMADGWLYSGWVVGASRIRSVDAHWPEMDARLHHSVGAWPLLINDSTRVAAADPGRKLELIARGWPVGEAKVVITLEDLGPQCRVTIAEDAVRGPGLAVPKMVRDPLIRVRNTETLKRLELMAAGGAGT
ncbi:SRPBCC family protein [Arthrobacter sp. ISL-5]|uniref:SRPBCC family protein n=1 Tax=Arthrobacter sp. ISL-5 TaxID=2819111 RepID=UPI002035DA19|nr:SRPBCC family protein [Arthrobacter sp. ISL-5]